MNKKLDHISNKRILITGGNGFIGRHLIDALQHQGNRLTVLDHSKPRFANSLNWMIGDLKNRNFVAKVVRLAKPEIVYHLAANKLRSVKFEDFYKSLDVNLLGSLNLFSALSNVKKIASIIVVGTAEEYGDKKYPFREDMVAAPVSAYSFSKLCLTNLAGVLARSYRLPFVIVRPTLAYGPGQANDMFLPALITTLVKNKSFSMTHGQQTRDYIFISDLIDAFLKIPTVKIPFGEIVNIGSGAPIKIIHLARMTGRLMAKNKLIRIGKKVYRTQEIMDYCVDIKKSQKILKWAPRIPLEEGLPQTINFYRRCL